jgi:hypothetical protein
VARRLSLALVCAANLIAVLGASIVNAALPSIGTGLGFSPISLEPHTASSSMWLTPGVDAIRHGH